MRLRDETATVNLHFRDGKARVETRAEWRPGLRGRTKGHVGFAVGKGPEAKKAQIAQRKFHLNNRIEILFLIGQDYIQRRDRFGKSGDGEHLTKVGVRREEFRLLRID